MTTEVKLLDLGADEVMQIVRSLREQGLVQGKDFDFSYHQSKYDMFGYEPPQPKHAIFKFYNEKHATFFALKYV
jgi:hypothetical protein